MSEARVKALLMDMLDHARLAIAFLDGKSDDELNAEPMRLFAIIRAVEVVGEAASKVDLSARQSIEAIPWREAIGMRNLLIHGYGQIKTSIVADTVRLNFPGLVSELERLMNDKADHQ